ncbi:peptidyl-prolyl cis-trans isomerase [Colwellia psychrerythraea]|uniref:PpiC-type peptidyl-prolyl cis-trans isomerase n=1 Tax=Colwellia psychrerythraea TaxID=28229 RepID=A0A099KB20_COLPS|nr:peptidylprolyl isomerase [Colwellia psychrerythraea]KGJ86798.1 PpiC-type peptidyl-prolyl cis-trans isomerase [Colwellia psychrerythraea]
MNALSQSITILLGSILLLSSCNHAEEKKHDLPVEHSAILAQVNNEVITDEDVQFFINKTFGSNSVAIRNQQIKKNILASLVASKAMKIAMQGELSQDKINDIKIKTQHYEEELFIKEYLEQYAIPEPVTSSMISSYYQEHLEQFGQVKVKTVEILQRKSKLNENERDAILTSLATINATDNWQYFAENKGKHLRLSYVKTKFSPGLFDKEVAEVIETLNKDENSKIIFVQGQPYIIRVIAIQTLPAKSLSSVSTAIRKKLAALQLKKAVKESSKQVLQQVNVVYMESNG